MAGAIRFDGLVSGIDFTSIVEKMVSLQKRPITFLQDQVKTETARKAGLLTISARLVSLKGIIGQLGKTTFFDRTVVSSSNESILKASGSNIQSTGAFNFTVKKLAQAHQLVSTGFASKTSALGGGTVSIEFGNGFVDRRTSVDFLNGQTGIDRGVMRLRTAAGQSVNVDMTDAITVQDVVDRLNNNGVVSITASVDNDSIAIANGTGSTLFVEDVDADTTASSLGISGSVGVGGTLRGSRINTITGSTETRLLNDGLGVRSVAGNDIQVTTRDGSSFFVDFDAADTRVQDLLDAVNNATGNGGKVVARVNAEGNAIELLDTTAGAGTLSVATQNSSNARIDLGFQGVVSELNGVQGAAGSNYLLGKRVIPTLNSILKRTLNGGSSEFRPIGGADPDGVPDGTITIRGRNGTTTSVDVSTRLQTTLTSDPVVGATSFDVASTSGLAVGNEIRLVTAAGLQETQTITGIAGNTITVARPLVNDFGLGDSALSSNQTLQDVINAVDNAAGQNLAVSFNNAGNGLLVRDTTASATRALMITGAPSTSLGIDTSTTGLKGDSLGTLTTLVDANLVGYATDYFVGATVNVTAGTNSGYSGTVTAFNGTTGTLTLAPAAGAAFDATSEYRIDAVLGDREAGSDLDPQYVGDNTLLSTLNQGKGVFAGRFTVTDSSGVGFTVDLRQSDDDSIGDVLEEVNGAASAAGSDLRARVNSTGDGIELIDPTGAGAIRVVDLDGGTTAEDLNIAGSAPTTTPGTLDGSFERTFTLGATDTLEDLAQTINSAGLDVVASVLNTGSGVNPFRLSLLSRTSGLAGRLVTNSSVAGLDFATSANAQDSVLLYGSNGGAGDPAVITGGTNTVTNIVPGLALDLKSASSTSVTVTVGRDVEGISTQVKRFVEAYNAAIDDIKELTRFDPDDPESKGILFGDNTVSGVQRALSSNISRAVEGIPVNELNSLGKVGVRVDSTGRLAYNEGDLAEKLNSDFDGVKRLFTLQRGLSPDVLLADLNDGRGVNTVNGDDFTIFQRDGSTVTVSISSLTTVSQILSAVNADSENTGLRVDAAITSDGNSFELVDNSPGLDETTDASGAGTFTDAALTGFADDFWTGQEVTFTSGALAGQTFAVTDFVSATGTITFDGTGDPGAGSTYRLVHDFEVRQVNNSRAAADLGINVNVGTDNRLTGRRVNVSKDPGVGRRFEIGVGDLTNLPDGLIPSKTSGIDDGIEDLNDRIERLNDRAEALRDRLIRRFAALENFLANSQGIQNQIANTLTNAVSSLKGSVSRK